IQADWRWLATATSNGAFGYNFEGALQEYVLLDERIVLSPEGESMLLPAPIGDRSASAYALVEPWACVEQSYQVRERRMLKSDGELLVVAESPADPEALKRLLAIGKPPRNITWLSNVELFDAGTLRIERLGDAPDTHFDDILYFGHNPETVTALFSKAARNGLITLCLCGGAFGRPVSVGLGAIHYRGVRLTGTTGSDPAIALNGIPETGEIRKGDKVQVIGAGGPMGVMHVVRNLCRGIPEISLIATDVSDERLDALRRIAAPSAETHRIPVRFINSKAGLSAGPADYQVIMAPIPQLVAAAVVSACPGGRLNIFAGIPVDRYGDIDLDLYIANGLYFIGTSGSLLEDMKIVLENVRRGDLDTNVSVAAVTGLDGAVDGIRAVETQSIAGKIMVYPRCHGLGLTPLDRLPEKIRSKLRDDLWTREAEDALLNDPSFPRPG
ncbi:MAG: alcohol dehydrogenase, partial [Kiritimatiellia bacterium]|nr:alcohol dehydrogenase [Kiritimatiellia bacterium]